MPMEKEIISWKVAEYVEHQRTADWYWWIGLIAVTMLGFAIWEKSFLFGVLVLLSWFVITLYAARPPRTLNIAISENGIVVENNLYPWANLKSFWIFYNPPLKQELSVESKKTLMPYIKIPLGETSPEKVKKIISKFIPEIEQQESLIDNLSNLAKF